MAEIPLHDLHGNLIGYFHKYEMTGEWLFKTDGHYLDSTDIQLIANKFEELNK